MKARAAAGRLLRSLARWPRPRNEMCQLPQPRRADPQCGVPRQRSMTAGLVMTMIVVSEVRTTGIVATRRARTGMMGAVALVVAVADVAARAPRVVSEPLLREPRPLAHRLLPALLSRGATVGAARAVRRIAEAHRIGLNPMIAARHPADAMDAPHNKPLPSLGDHAVTVAASAAHPDSGIPSSCRTLRLPRGKSWVNWS